MMTQETLNLIRKEYLEALKKSSNILEILTTFCNRLDIIKINPKDEKRFEFFMSGIKNCILDRKQTCSFTNLTITLTNTIFYILMFMNNRKGINIDANIISRRKSLTRDLIKTLNKSQTNCPFTIRDRFGIRIVDLNNAVSNNELYVIFDYIQGILCDTNRHLRSEFLEYGLNLEDDLAIPFIEGFSKLHLKIDFFKDFIKNPKNSGYESLHFCVQVATSRRPLMEYHLGQILEVQLRTLEMDKSAEDGDYGHKNYEESIPKEIREVFELSDDIFDSINIPGFTSLKSEVGDEDGINSPKSLGSRRASKNLAIY